MVVADDDVGPVAAVLGMKGDGLNERRINMIEWTWNIEISHWTGQMRSK